MLPDFLDDAFYDQKRSPTLPFVIDDTVRVRSGPYAKREGAVVVLDRSREEPRYLVEFVDGTDELFTAAELTLVKSAV